MAGGRSMVNELIRTGTGEYRRRDEGIGEKGATARPARPAIRRLALSLSPKSGNPADQLARNPPLGDPQGLADEGPQASRRRRPRGAGGGGRGRPDRQEAG